MSEKLRAILIDPKQKLVSEVHIEPGLDAIYEQIGVDIFDLARIGPKDWIYVDDGGMYQKVQHYFVHANYPQPLINRALILGDGESTTFTLEEATAMIAFEAN